MTIAPGTRLGPYEIVAPLGAGGMGEVYRGRDTRLERDVAIKILPESFAQNEQFRARFEREAKTISSLNHPNICTLHDVGHSVIPSERGESRDLLRADSFPASRVRNDGVSRDRNDGVAPAGEITAHYLVMELIDGESLADRLEKGPLPIEQVIRYGAQIADALGRAHRQGIVHRDLKPGNVMLAKSGAKLLDFGLARSGAEAAPISGLTNMPTQAKPLTTEGTILGTFQYMAPEQLEGQEADARTDIFALGAVLYEMATGRRAFEGHSKTSLIAAIVASQPPPIASVQSMTPAVLDRIVRKCLEKDPDDRWQSAYDIASELRWVADEQPAPTPARGGGLRLTIAAAFVALVAGAAIAWWVTTRASATGGSQPVIQASIEAPENGGFVFIGDYAGTPVVSPDGTKIAYCIVGAKGISQLWVRDLAIAEARPLAGTDGAYFPFWSPDSQSVAYFSRISLVRVDLAGGTPRTLAPASQGKGGSWGSTGEIVFSPDAQQPLSAVPASGGQVRQVTKLDASRHSTHRFPHFLADGNRFLYFAASHQDAFGSASEIWISSLDGSTAPRMVVKSVAEAQISRGKLLTIDGNELVAFEFDEREGKVKGPSVPLNLQAAYDKTTWKAGFSVSASGPLAYVPVGGEGGFDVNWYSRDGSMTPSGLPVGNYMKVEISPSGETAVFEAQYDRPNSDLWTADLRSGVRTRLTVETVDQTTPTWAPDESKVYFGSNQMGDAAVPGSVIGPSYRVFSRRADGGGGERLVYAVDGTSVFPWDVSPDGQYLLIAEGDYLNRYTQSLYAIHTEGEPRPIPIQATGAGAGDASFSPDGRLIAFSSAVTGRVEVYVVQFVPDPSTSAREAAGRWQVSNAGGRAPRWRGDGRELYYIRGDNKLVAVPVEMKGNSFVVGRENELFQAPFREDSISYDVVRSGERFLVATLSTTSRTPFRIVSGWPELLRKR